GGREGLLPARRDLLGAPAALAQLEDGLAGMRPEAEAIAADPDALAGDRGGLLGREEHDQSGAVLGHAEGMLLADRARQSLTARHAPEQRRIGGGARGTPPPGRRPEPVSGGLRAREL